MQAESVIKLGLRESDILYIEQLLSHYKSIYQCIIFGSRAKGTYRNGSDVDLALSGKEVNMQIVRDVSYKLNEESPLPYHFDIVSLNIIDNAALKEHIERVGIVVYCNSELQ